MTKASKAPQPETEEMVLEPQPGPQTIFFTTSADVALYGGAAGGGKSFALLLEPLRHYDNPKFGAVIFRREAVQVRNEGGLWDESENLYLPMGGKPREQSLDWRFPTKSRVKFSHLEYDKDVLKWQGAQIPLMGFDELTHFTEKQFFYMLSRNRSTCGVRPYVRATCNPDAESWVRKFIDWWIDPKTGLAIPERSGVIRWFIRLEDTIYWEDSEEAIYARFGRGDDIKPKSFTFISASLSDNKILMEKDPGYKANLLALSRIDRLRLLGGNWNVKPTAGLFFQRSWFPVIKALPVGEVVRTIRAWDKAATKPSPENPDPDWTRGVRMHKLKNGRFVISHVASMRDTPLQVERLVKNTASQDGVATHISIAQDPGSAGVNDRDNFIRLLAGYVVKVNKPSVDKVTRAKPLSAQCEAGNVDLVEGDWNEAFLNELENFDGGRDGVDDQVDAAADALNELSVGVSILDVL